MIVRNLKLSKSPAPTDLIEIQASTNVWIDHNEFSADQDHNKDCKCASTASVFATPPACSVMTWPDLSVDYLFSLRRMHGRQPRV